MHDLILLYDCKNWIVSEKLLRQLESFQGEMGKRILGLPWCTSYSSWHSAGLALSAHQDTGEEVVLFKEIGFRRWEHACVLRLLADDRDSEPSL